MKPSELYKREPERVSMDLWELSSSTYRREFPELDEIYPYFPNNMSVNTRIKIKIHKFHNFDGRRFWQIKSVWLDDLPVMVMRNAGREGDDFSDRIITNENRFYELMDYLYSILEDYTKYDISDCLRNEEEDVFKLTEFYGIDLADFDNQNKELL